MLAGCFAFAFLLALEGLWIRILPKKTTPSSVKISTMPVSYPQFLLFGDSITQQSFQPGGLGQHLADDYQRKLDVINRGFSGYNTRWGLEVAQRVFPSTDSAKLKAMTMWWGANDACLPKRTQSIPVSEFKQNLNTFIDMIQSPKSPFYHPECTMFILSCPPICIPQRFEDVQRRFGLQSLDDLDRTFERTQEFAEAAKLVAEQRGVAYVPVFEAFMKKAGEDVETGLRRLFVDGLHPNPAGYQVAFEALHAVITSNHPELLSENTERHFPDWSVIDPKHPEKSFPTNDSKANGLLLQQ